MLSTGNVKQSQNVTCVQELCGQHNGQRLSSQKEALHNKKQQEANLLFEFIFENVFCMSRISPRSVLFAVGSILFFCKRFHVKDSHWVPSSVIGPRASSKQQQ